MPYNKISDIDRARIIKSYDDEEDFVYVASTLGIKRSTAYSIVKTYAETGRKTPLARGGGRPKIIDSESIDFLIELIEKEPMVTLKYMKEQLQNHFPHKPSMHIATIGRALDGQMVTLKKCHDLPVGRFVHMFFNHYHLVCPFKFLQNIFFAFKSNHDFLFDVLEINFLKIF